MLSTSRRLLALVAATVVTASLLAGCGSSGEGSSSEPLSLKITENGSKASFEAPKSATGGLVTVSLANEGKAPHGVQFIQYTGDHTSDDVLKQFGSNSTKTPSWIKLSGGIGSVPPGQTDSADLNLPAGNYVLADAAAFGGPSSAGPPATTDLEVSGGSSGTLPPTPATVTAATAGKDKFKWEISGLEAGSNSITFSSKGDDSLHLILAVPVKGKAPPVGQIKKDLASNGPPPPYADLQSVQSTAALDGGLSQTTTLDLKKPGQYIFFCPLTDRDGGKPHDQEGLLAVQSVE